MNTPGRTPATLVPASLVPALVLAAALLVLPAARAPGLGTEKPWLGGVYAGTCGFSEPTGLPAAEYLAVGLFLEPFSLPALNLAAGGGFLLPLAPWGVDGVRLQLMGDLTIVDVPAPGLERIFYNSLCWSPGVGAELLVSLDFATASFALLVSPLRFRAGDGVFTLCSAHLFLEPGPALAGWGLTLFQASLFIF